MAARAEPQPISGTPAVAVVIPAWNAAATIGRQLSALAQQEYDGIWQVVVVDNGSSDETSAVATTYVETFPVDLCVVRLEPPNRGVGAARNAGVQATDAPLVVFCDADDEVAPGWVRALAAALASAAGAGGRLEVTRLNSVEMLPWSTPMADWQQTWLVSSEWGMPSPVGACCAVTRVAWSSVGGFNERLGDRGEDVDFFWRLQLAGHALADAPGAVVNYRLAPTPLQFLAKLYRTGRSHTMLLWAFRHPKRRRQLLLQVAGAVRRTPRLLRSSTRRSGIYDLVLCAGRVGGIPPLSGRLPAGPQAWPLPDDGNAAH